MHQHDPIDRISPTLEPDQQVLLYQNWHHLLFLHWEVPVAELQALIPSRLTVDTYDGKAYIGLVPFTLSGVRAVGTPPLPWISEFHEVNVRTYVHLKGADPGVWFFSLDASGTLAVAAARAAYKLAYFEAEMAFRTGSEPIPTIDFESRRTDERGALPAGARIQYRAVEGPVTHAAPGTLDHFLLERYILYTQDADHELYRARIHHQPYQIQRADVSVLDETLVWAAGVRRPGGVDLRHYASEVNVKVYPLQKL